MDYTFFNKQTFEIFQNVYLSEDLDILKTQTDTVGIVVGKYLSSDYYINGSVIEYSEEVKIIKANKPNNFYTWSNITFNWVNNLNPQEQYTNAEISVKEERNQLLADSDWTQIPNGPLTQQQQEAWATYRQELRDITDQSGYPLNITWPTQP